MEYRIVAVQFDSNTDRVRFKMSNDTVTRWLDPSGLRLYWPFLTAQDREALYQSMRSPSLWIECSPEQKHEAGSPILPFRSAV